MSYTYAPRLDITEHDDRWLIEAELPGVSENQINIESTRGVLSIRTKANTTIQDSESDAEEKVPTPKSNNFSTITKEWHSGPYARDIRVSNDIDTSAISAAFEHGLLTITAPKTAQATPQRISINAE